MLNKNLINSKLIVLSLVLVFFSFVTGVSTANAETIDTIEDIELNELIEMDLIFIDGTDLSGEEIQIKLRENIQERENEFFLNNILNYEITPYSKTVLTSAIIKISADFFQYYMNYSGTATINSFRFRNLQIASTSLLFPTTYYQEAYIFRETGGRASGSQYVTTFNAPSDSKKLRVKLGGVDANYHLTGWKSAEVLLDRTITVK